MNTEKTEVKRIDAWLLYDGDCQLCVGLAARFRKALERRGFRLAPLQTPWVTKRLGLSGEPLLREMRLLLPDERIYGGADAVLEISRRFWWVWPVYFGGVLPGGKVLLRVLYHWISEHRCSTTGQCRLEHRKRHRGTRTFLELP